MVIKLELENITFDISLKDITINFSEPNANNMKTSSSDIHCANTENPMKKVKTKSIPINDDNIGW